MVEVTLVDLHGSLVDTAAAKAWRSWPGVELRGYTNITEIETGPDVAFVSPANSLGFMDGGIDLVLSRVMFPGVEARVKAAIAERGTTTLLGRPYLPIGEAVVVPAAPDGTRLVVAPTMWLPQDVRVTHNAYHATYAALRAASEAQPPVRRLVFPGMTTGCGMVNSVIAVSMMAAAHADFEAGRPPQLDAAAIAAEQPTWYENTEFKVIEPGAVVLHP